MNNLQNINTANTGLRFFTVYGPWGRPDMALFLFTKAILEDKPIKVFNNGNMVRDFTYIDDIVEGVTRVIDTPPNNKNNSALSPHLGGDASVTPEGGRQRGSQSPLDARVPEGGTTEGNPSHQHNANSGPHSNSTNASQSSPLGELEGAPDTPIAKGIEDFIEWYKSYFGIQ